MQNKKLKNSPIFIAFQLLNKEEKFKLRVFVLIQTLLSLLDLIGVIIIGALGALSVQGLESRRAGNKVSHVLKLVGIENFSFQSQVSILGISAALTLLLKTCLSIYTTRKVFYFLGRKSSQISSDLIAKLLTLQITELQKWSSQNLLYITTIGVKNVMVGILATAVNLFSDFSILIVLSLGLLSLDPGIAIAAIAMFCLVGAGLHFLLQVRARAIGKEEYLLTVKSNRTIIEVLSAFRESVVRNRQQFYSRVIQNQQLHLGRLVAEINFQPFISKYVLESATVLGTLALAGYEFATKSAVYAISILGVFMAASSRIAPAALRIQQSILVIKNSSGSSEGTIQLMRDLSEVSITSLEEISKPRFSYEDFTPELKLSNLSFSYPENNNFSLSRIDLRIPAGSSLAIVGPSGSGKRTLVDLILGVLRPQSGIVEISGCSPQTASKNWPGAVSYVPQNISIIDGSIKENVSQGYPLFEDSDKQILTALEKAQLLDYVQKLPDGLDSQVGEQGSNLSGGQRQRLGIARAFYTNPKLLVLDEATSSLDSQTELALSAELTSLAGVVTTIIVAHRLSTIRNADQVVYLESGKILSVGTFDEVRASIPNFDSQAKLMGM